jgi:hypothetical protein
VLCPLSSQTATASPAGDLERVLDALCLERGLGVEALDERDRGAVALGEQLVVLESRDSVGGLHVQDLETGAVDATENLPVGLERLPRPDRLGCAARDLVGGAGVQSGCDRGVVAIVLRVDRRSLLEADAVAELASNDVVDRVAVELRVVAPLDR